MKKYIPLYRKCHNGSDEIIHVNDSEIFLYYIVALYEFYFIPHIVCGKLGIQYNFTYCDLSQIFICETMDASCTELQHDTSIRITFVLSQVQSSS